MNIIPNETLVKVLGYLNYDDLLIVKNVCHRFRSAVGYVIERSTVWVKDENRYAPIHAKREDDYSQFAKLFYEFENRQFERCLISRHWKRFRLIVDYHQSIKKLILSNPFLISLLNTFTNLQHLELLTESWASKEFQMDFKRHHNLEHFEHLEQFEHLEILENETFRNTLQDYRISFKREEAHAIYLNLTRLRTLYFITDFSFKKVPIILACPVLNKIVTDINLDCFRMKYPNSIEEIVCEENSLSLSHYKNLRKFTCLYFNHNYSGFLYSLKNLKEFHFYKFDDSSFLNLSFNQIKVFYKNVEFLPNQTLQGSLKKLSISTLNDSSMEFYSRNFKLLSKSNQLIQSELRTSNFKYINSELIEKLANIKIFHINYDESDKSRYLEVFKVCNLDKLIVRSPFVLIDQAFLDLIPKFNPMLTYLKVDDFENLKFLLELKYLKVLKTEQFFDFELVKKMFDCLHYLKTIEILITVDIYKFKLADNQITCSYNHEIFLEEPKQLFINREYQNCIYKLFQLFITNYK